MNLWLVSRTDVVYYDEYDSAVVMAKTEEEAISLFPDELSIYGKKLIVELLGKANLATKKKYAADGVVCSSFNAG